MSRRYEQIPEFERPEYDDEWILKGLDKHQAMYSMVLYFDSGDPARFEQLKFFFTHHPLRGYEHHDIYIYDPWKGLGQLDKSTGTMNYDIYEGETKRGASLKDETKDNKRGKTSLPKSLSIMDAKLKTEKIIFILHSLISDSDRDISDENLDLLSAMRSWATSKEIISLGSSTELPSLIILMGNAVTSLLDKEPETKDLVATIAVEAGKETEYENLIDVLASRFDLSQLIAEQKKSLTLSLKGLNLHQAEATLRESYKIKSSFDLDQIKSSKADQVRKTGILEVEEPMDGFEGIGGYDEVKQFIKNKMIRIMRMQDRANKFAIPLPRGVLLFGPPGTGKTLFAKALAKEVQLPFINIKTENIYTQWLGESGRKMKTAIRTANDMSPAIVFIDEIDRFGKRADSRDSAGEETRRVFSQLLEWLGDPNRKAIIVGTTNIPEHIDPAFLRTGRFDYKIPIYYPNKEARLEILKVHLGISEINGKKSPKPKPPLSLSDSEFILFLKKEIIPHTRFWAGAELEELVNRAKRNAFERDTEAVEPEDFKKSIKLFRIEDRGEQLEKLETQIKKYTDDQTFIKNLNID